MRLPVTQRSCVILMDVLGHSLEEIRAVTEMSVPSFKAALHRGRTRLREISDEPEDYTQPALACPSGRCFNAHDFDALRDMLAEDVRLGLVSHLRMNGRKEVSNYFGNYASIGDWHLVPGRVDGQPEVLVCDPRSPPQRRPISSCSTGRKALSPASAISGMRATSWKALNSPLTDNRTDARQKPLKPD
jgi:RNA polymerase sigma-70 factor (ECF subfamily)